MRQYKTAFDHIQDKTAADVGSKTIKIINLIFTFNKIITFNSDFFVWIAFSESVVI